VARKARPTKEDRMEELKPCEMPCPKCGGTIVNRQFWGKGRQFYLHHNEKDRERDNEFLKLKTLEFTEAKKDCISNHCRTCHYEWETAPMNTRKGG
jgi:hypothetical protein